MLCVLSGAEWIRIGENSDDESSGIRVANTCAPPTLFTMTITTGSMANEERIV